MKGSPTADRIAVVTGGLTGIGAATARALEAAGCKVAAASRSGGFAPLDVADAGSVAAFMEKVEAELGPADILVNAAGIYREAEIDDHDDADWRDQIETNLTGVFNMTRAFLPSMKARSWGTIVNIASTAAHVAAPGYAAYCASKAGVVALSKVTALEGAPHGVSCVSVSPTWVETPMMDNAAIRHAGPGGDAAAAKEALKESNPQGRLVQPEEIAALIAFCCSDAAPALTNEDILVNAGALW